MTKSLTSIKLKSEHEAGGGGGNQASQERISMVDETDLSQEKKWFYEVRAGEVIKNLLKRNMNGQYVASRHEALTAVMEMIPPGATIARGDSISVEQVGVLEELIKRDQNKLINPVKRDENGSFVYNSDDRYRLEREAFFADAFITGTNAITLDGKLVSTDGIGNRVSPMVYGPKKVIVVVGVNKIVNSVDEALARIHEVAAPINAMRHYLKHNIAQLGDLPCVKTGKCVDCNHAARICRYTVIIEGSDIMHKGRINVVLVGEELGI